MKTLLLILLLCSFAFAKDKPVYQDATLQRFTTKPTGFDCDTGKNALASGTDVGCSGYQESVYTVKAGAVIYKLTPWEAWGNHEALWGKLPGTAVEIWNDGKRVHVRVGKKESRYDILGMSTQ